jgi:hypothetical protein
LVWTLSLLPASISLLKEPAIDGRILAGSSAIAAICLALVSAWPAIVALRLARGPSRQSTAATRRMRHSHMMIVSSQVALGFVLLTAGGLTLVSVAEAYRNDTGYRRDQAVLLEVFAQHASGSQTPVEILRSLPGLLASVPGVRSVAASTIGPLFAERANSWTSVVPEGRAWLEIHCLWT